MLSLLITACPAVRFRYVKVNHGNQGGAPKLVDFDFDHTDPDRFTRQAYQNKSVNMGKSIGLQVRDSNERRGIEGFVYMNPSATISIQPTQPKAYCRQVMLCHPPTQIVRYHRPLALGYADNRKPLRVSDACPCRVERGSGLCCQGHTYAL